MRPQLPAPPRAPVNPMKKVTLQEIAKSLNISRTTVWKVFSGHDGVSDALRDRVLTRARELGYQFPEHMAGGTVPGVSSTSIALAVCRPETSIFWMKIIHQVAKELSFLNVNLVYTYLPSAVDGDYVLPPSLTNGSTQGMIVMNVYNEQLVRMLASLSVPKVFLDTPTHIPASQLNGDLLLMESSDSVSRITEHLILQGKKSFGFIGDIDYAKSNRERYDGFLNTLIRHHIPRDPSLLLTGAIGMDTHKEEIDAFLDTCPRMPDAFVCVSDYVASILIQLLNRRGYRVPEDVAVAGFDRNLEHPLAEDLTSVQVFNQDIGQRLAHQIVFRMKHPKTRYEITYVSSEPIFRASTGDAPDPTVA